jgi:predicted acylesterase/phospholipase RssA
MTIKHLVLSGGGPIGFRFLGILEELNKNNYWSIENIENIYATSIGTIIGAFLCLNFEWDILKKYIIERPWHDAFKLNGKQIFDAYYKKGLYDKRFMEIIFKPLLAAKDLDLNITLNKFYEYSKIEFYLYTFELNNFETVELSYKTHPELTLMEALTMSCALPGLFIPTIIENNCYIDGGVMMNYPINYALKNHNKDEIFGINFKNSLKTNYLINEDSNILEFIVKLSTNAMNYITNTVPIEELEQEIICESENSVLTLDMITDTMSNIERRRSLINDGIEDGKKYLANQNKEKSILYKIT